MAQAQSPWLLPDPTVRIEPLRLPGSRTALILRDDLLDPLCGGNKLRKLDGWLPELLGPLAPPHILTLGGAQSAHCGAVAALVARHDPTKQTHVLLRGPLPSPPTGHLLVSLLFAHHVEVVERDEYANRQDMIEAYLEEKGITASVIPEGAHHPQALSGLDRLVAGMAKELDPHLPYRLVVDCGTGTTAMGLACAIKARGLAWHVDGVMLLGSAHDFETLAVTLTGQSDLPLTWWPRASPRRFGALQPGDIATCKAAARLSGVSFDPIYTLSCWRHVCAGHHDPSRSVVIHTGGILGLFGVAQRVPDDFLT